MPRYSSDTVTVVTGDSSLNNLAYQPSQQEESGDENSECLTEGNSALSSVRSSVRRDWQNRKSHGATSTQSYSTRQSAGMLWQDSESEVELYSSSTDEEAASDLHDSKRQLGTRENDSESFSSTESTSTSDGTPGAPSHEESATEEGSADSQRSFHDLEEESTTASGDSQRKQSAKCSNKSEPLKRLRFSTEALAQVVQSRMSKDHSIAATKVIMQGKLQHVDYVSAIDNASTDHDISTFYRLGKEECDEVFKDRVPFEVPVSQPSTDDLSSIHALSTRMPLPPKSDEAKTDIQLKNVSEERSMVLTLPEIDEEAPTNPANNEEAPPSNRARRWIQIILTDRSDTEVFLTTLVLVSFVVLVALLIILFVT